MLNKCGVPASLLSGLKTKPTIAIIAGAWQNPDVYTSLRETFTSMGYPSVCLSPPSTTLPHGDTDLAADVAFVRDKVLLPSINEGKDVVLLMHSFGGVYGGSAAKGLSKTEREKEGKKGGIVALVYMAAAAVPSGMTTLERMGVGEELLPWVKLDVSKLMPQTTRLYTLYPLFSSFSPPYFSQSLPIHTPF
jgi:pimeloyl-ACP methyl ester carboxylesterase